MVALAGFPLLLETACRLRATPHTELAEFRRGWAGVQALVVVNPSVMPSPHFTDIVFLGRAFPEIYRVQPRGVLRKVIIEGRYIHERFAHALGGALGAVPGQWQEAEKQALSQALLELPPVYVESADRGYGLCVVCGKKGVLGRCERCGALMHYTCIRSEGPGEDQKCPVCHRMVEDDGAAYPHLMDLGAPRAQSLKKTAAEPAVSTELLPPRLVFPAEVRPTDEEAQEKGFPTAKEWYVQTSTPIRHGLEAARPALEADFETAQQASEPSAASEPASHLWPPVPQEGVEPLDALDTFGPLPAGGG